MAKPGNKRRGEFAIPEFGDGAFFRFDVDALERLEDEYGEEYFDIVLKGLSKARIPVFKLCLEVALVGADIELSLKKIPHEISTDLIKEKLYDALFVTVYGRTFKEQQAHEEERLLKQIEEAETDPRKAAYLSSMLYAAQDTEQGSNPPKSVD